MVSAPAAPAARQVPSLVEEPRAWRPSRMTSAGRKPAWDSPGGVRWARHEHLRIWASLRRTDSATRAQYACPHACCTATSATLTHIFVTCPLAAAVVTLLSATWGALTGGPGPPHSAYLFLADDRRAWAPIGPPQGLWQRLRLPCSSAYHRRTGQRRRNRQLSRAISLRRKITARFLEKVGR